LGLLFDLAPEIPCCFEACCRQMQIQGKSEFRSQQFRGTLRRAAH
jgi:hypothetical protein